MDPCLHWNISCFGWRFAVAPNILRTLFADDFFLKTNNFCFPECPTKCTRTKVKEHSGTECTSNHLLPLKHTQNFLKSNVMASSRDANKYSYTARVVDNNQPPFPLSMHVFVLRHDTATYVPSHSNRTMDRYIIRKNNRGELLPLQYNSHHRKKARNQTSSQQPHLGDPLAKKCSAAATYPTTA